MADQLTSRAGPGGNTSYSYDANGNQTAAGANAFTYDLANRTLTASVGLSATNYAYDGEGNRASSTITGTAPAASKYLWDTQLGVPQLALERDSTGGVLRRYTYGNQRISESTGGSDYYYHHDRLGSVVNLTDSAGAGQWSYSYEPFGTARTATKNATSAPANPMRFAGEQLDAETGLYNLRARLYDPSLGRFTSTDPLPPEITDPYVSAYAYVNNRPTALVDPSGQRGRRIGFKIGIEDFGRTPFRPSPRGPRLGGPGVVITGGLLTLRALAEAGGGGIPRPRKTDRCSAAPYTTGGGCELVPVWFGQKRISPRYTGGSIEDPPSGVIQVFTDARAPGVYIAEANRTLAAYSLAGATTAPACRLSTVSARVRGRLDEGPLPPQTSLPSPVVRVTQNQEDLDPVPPYQVTSTVSVPRELLPC